MGFYVNVVAKQGCSRQINTAWKKAFGGFLVYTPSKINKEIEFIKNDPKQQHLTYVNDVKTWDKTFPIHANGRGQVFLRAFGYEEERAEEFSKESDELRAKVKFILEHRLLFQRISGLQDAVHTLDMEINGDFVENGKLNYYEYPSFDKLPQKHNHPVFIRCLELDRPDIWEAFLLYQEDNTKWSNLKNNSVIKYGFGHNSTIWQRCESIASARDNEYYGGTGRYSKGNVPSEYDIIKAITLKSDDFDSFLSTLKNAYFKLYGT